MPFYSYSMAATFASLNYAIKVSYRAAARRGEFTGREVRRGGGLGYFSPILSLSGWNGNVPTPSFSHVFG